MTPGEDYAGRLMAGLNGSGYTPVQRATYVIVLYALCHMTPTDRALLPAGSYPEYRITRPRKRRKER